MSSIDELNQLATLRAQILKMGAMHPNVIADLMSEAKAVCDKASTNDDGLAYRGLTTALAYWRRKNCSPEALEQLEAAFDELTNDVLSAKAFGTAMARFARLTHTASRAKDAIARDESNAKKREKAASKAKSGEPATKGGKKRARSEEESEAGSAVEKAPKSEEPVGSDQDGADDDDMFDMEEED